ncbi:MAG: C-type lectin domain-containing protein [Oscillospiraceae bacterium]|nr:C-type lectin domain-containing protein [Oscillospiraceae bacterium]
MNKKIISLFLTLCLTVGLLYGIPSTVTVNAADNNQKILLPMDGAYYNGHTYLYFDNWVTWNDAKTFCDAYGGHLVCFETVAEQNYIMSLGWGGWTGAKLSGNGWTRDWVWDFNGQVIGTMHEPDPNIKDDEFQYTDYSGYIWDPVTNEPNSWKTPFDQSVAYLEPFRGLNTLMPTDLSRVIVEFESTVAFIFAENNYDMDYNSSTAPDGYLYAPGIYTEVRGYTVPKAIPVNNINNDILKQQETGQDPVHPDNSYVFDGWSYKKGSEIVSWDGSSSDPLNEIKNTQNGKNPLLVFYADWVKPLEIKLEMNGYNIKSVGKTIGITGLSIPSWDNLVDALDFSGNTITGIKNKELLINWSQSLVSFIFDYARAQAVDFFRFGGPVKYVELTTDPNPIILTVTVKNNTNKIITGENTILTINLGENFSTPDGKHEITIEDIVKYSKDYFYVPWIPANGEIKLNFTVDPREFERYIDKEGTSYNSIIEANLSYPNDFVASRGGTSISSSFKETGWQKSDKITVTKTYDDSKYTYMNPDGSFIQINCPVDVQILDAKGTLLATVSTGDEDGVEIDGLTAYADGDAKYVSIPKDKLFDFQIQLEATDDGTMNVISYDVDGDSIGNAAAFANIPLTKGETFDTALSKDDTTQLFVTQNGKRTTEIKPDVVVNDATLTDALTTAGLSAWALTDTKSAVMRGIATPDLLTNFQANTTRAEFCRAAVNLVEKYYGKPVADVLTDRSLQAKTFADTTDPAIGAAAALGITNGTDAAKNLFSPDSTLTREQAAAMLKRTLDVIGVTVDGKVVTWSDAGDISSYAVDSINMIYSAGVMNGTSTSLLVFSPKTPYTHEQSIVTLNRLWDFLHKSNP